MTDLTKLIELQAAATPGPWEQSHRQKDGGMYSTQVYTVDGETVCTLHWYAKPEVDGVIGTYRPDNARFIAAARNFDFAALDEKIKRYEEVLRTIAEYGDEENEWDAVDKYKDVRDVARKALEQ